ncbi:flagellar biosynthesis protein FliS [Desulfocucumis palustris]|uniref:Flagellar biosynthesis protein FliS n=1 Tax=Desulfocucumis palustris TaxID=1898651 RepID=A0A2L2XAQ8_9FIRM|nr:flagellar export chaperone FliS [Desulfocucumis palustris]GBF33180.1 flagellar biosynthesis protein FliS [Desulfocucumis palustris]
MAMANPYQQYQANSVNGASPGQLTLMLYNGAIKFINGAIKSLEENNVDRVNENCKRSQDIILYLSSTLNMEYEISKNLDSLYDYMYRRLVHANIQKDKEVMLEVLGLIEELRNTWAEMLKKSNG